MQSFGGRKYKNLLGRSKNTMENKNIVPIIGHKNPDIDSICSAISYAYLKNKISEKEQVNDRFFCPMRIGRISKETKFVLEKFNIEPVEYLTSIEPKAKDLKIRETTSIRDYISLKEAYNKMKEEGTVTIPVIDESGYLEGIISLTDIAESNMDMYDNKILAKTKTPIRNVLKSVEGSLLTGNEDFVIEKGKVLVGAGNPEVLGKNIEKDDLILLGDRYEAQKKALEKGAKVLVITYSAKVKDDIIELARQNNAVIISAPYDTYITARLLNQSMPIKYFMTKDKLYTFKLDDSLEYLKDVMKEQKFRNFPVLDKYGKYLGIVSRSSLMNLKKKEIILVDHNEFKQSVDGIESASILEIIDHHRLGAIETAEPLLFRCQPLGSTSTIIYEFYKEKNIRIPKKIASIMLAAILSDTLMFRSPTCTSLDRYVAEELSLISELNIEEFAEEMFRAGSDIEGMDADELFFQDFKKFNIGSKAIGISQINSMNTSSFPLIKNKLEPFIREHLKNLDVDIIYVLLTGILDGNSRVLFSGNNAYEILIGAFGE